MFESSLHAPLKSRDSYDGIDANHFKKQSAAVDGDTQAGTRSRRPAVKPHRNIFIKSSDFSAAALARLPAGIRLQSVSWLLAAELQHNAGPLSLKLSLPLSESQTHKKKKHGGNKAVGAFPFKTRIFHIAEA